GPLAVVWPTIPPTVYEVPHRTPFNVPARELAGPLTVGWSNVSQNAAWASPQPPDPVDGWATVVDVVLVVVVGAAVVVVVSPAQVRTPSVASLGAHESELPLQLTDSDWPPLSAVSV